MKEMGKVIETERDRGKNQVAQFSLISKDWHWVTDAGDWNNHIFKTLWEGRTLPPLLLGSCASWLALIACVCLAHNGGGCQCGRSSSVSEFTLINVHAEPLEWLDCLTVTLSKGHIWFCVMLVTWEKHLFLGSFLNKCMCIQVDFVSIDGSQFVSSVYFKSQKEAVNVKHKKGRY